MDLPFLMVYSGNAFDLFAEESSVLMKCLKNSVQHQSSPADESEEAKATRHSQMDAEIKASKKKAAAERKRCARSNMSQEEKSKVYQAGGKERKEKQRANMTQEEKHQDQAKERARKKEERDNMTQEEKKQDLEDARTRRAKTYATQIEDKAARQAAADKKLREMLYAPNGHVSELPPPEDWPDITQSPTSAMFTFMANSGCWRFADANRLPRESDQEGVTDPKHSADDLSWMTSTSADKLHKVGRLAHFVHRFIQRQVARLAN